MSDLPHNLDGELARRRMRRDYGAYCEYVNKPSGFYMTHFHRYLCNEIQSFLEAETERAMDILLLSVPPRHGKAMEKDLPVWTPDGWRTHGSLQVGDHLYHRDGTIATVTKVHPDYTDELWEITFATGETIRCSPQHLWNICYTDRSRKPYTTVEKLVETRDILQQSRYLLERSPYITVNGSLQGETKHLVRPYALGLWLGDGYSHNGSICGSLDDLAETLPYEDLYQTQENFGEARHVFDTAWLKQMGLYKNKHIPVEYLTADETSRRELLAGLLDSDGNMSRKNPTVEICLCNECLARDTYILVRSLGYKAQFIERKVHCQTNHEQPAWRVLWRPNDGDQLFHLERKQDILDQWSTLHRQSDVSSRYYIASVRKVSDHCLANCITVDGDGTYLAGPNLIPTHNSFTVTETLPSWFLGKHPEKEVIIAGYEGTFAEGFSRRNRDKFNTYCSDIFGSLPNDTVQGVALWETSKGGRCRAAGLKAGINGFGADLFIIDDPIKNQEAAMSETVLAKLHDEMGPSVQSRIYPGGKLIVIQTRWVENDVVGFIESNWGEYIYKTINLPCECEDPENDPLGRKLGDSLMGEHLGDFGIPKKICNDNKWLKSKKQLVIAGDGIYTWNALYQGHPTARNGNLFLSNWWQYYSRKNVRFEDFEYICLSVDATFKKTETSDMVAIELWGLRQNHAFLYKLINKRMGFVETIAKLRAITAEFQGIDELLVEDKANGSAIIDTLRNETGVPPIVAITPLGGKYSRGQAVSPFISTFACHIPNDFSDAEAAEVEWDGPVKPKPEQCFVEQHSKFPFIKHDDMVDSCTQALARLIKLITGEVAAPSKNYLIFNKWYPDMWEDYEALDEQGQIEFIKRYGAPLEWAPDDYVDKRSQKF